MKPIFMTKSTWPIIGWVALVLGWVMNGIYTVLEKIGISNVGLAIIIFTIVIYLAMTPLQVSQQRFSKLNAVMQPELKKIQDKYKGKRDQASQQAQMAETQAVYQKYGVSASGSCVQLLVQMPILFGLYQVIYKIPGYIGTIGNQLRTVAENSAFPSFFTKFVEAQANQQLTSTLGDGSTEQVMDALYRLNTNQWAALVTESKGQEFSTAVESLQAYISRVTSFLTLNISDSPMNILTDAWKTKSWLLIVAAILIPVLAFASQRLNLRLMPQPANNADTPGGSTMRTMNTTMPIISAIFCFSLPTGVGIYWIVGAVVRSVQAFFINKFLEKENLDERIKAAEEQAAAKREKQLEKRGYTSSQITESAHTKTKNLSARDTSKLASVDSEAEATPGSIADKARMVQRFNEMNGKKK